jgi:hypothetical protein
MTSARCDQCWIAFADDVQPLLPHGGSSYALYDTAKPAGAAFLCRNGSLALVVTWDSWAYLPSPEASLTCQGMQHCIQGWGLQLCVCHAAAATTESIRNGSSVSLVHLVKADHDAQPDTCLRQWPKHQETHRSMLMLPHAGFAHPTSGHLRHRAVAS